MQNKCNLILQEKFIKDILGDDKDLKDKYDKFLNSKKLLGKKNIKFCPFPDCDGYAEKKFKKYVKCNFGHEFCFDCGAAPHGIKPCSKIIDKGFEDWKAHEVLMSMQYHDKDDDNNEYKDILMNRVYKKIKPNGYFDTIDELTYRELQKKHKKNEEIPLGKKEVLCQEDYQEQDNIMYDKNGKNIYLLNPLRPGMRGHTHYLMSRDEIIQAFRENGHETENQEAILESIDNTVTKRESIQAKKFADNQAELSKGIEDKVSE
jgi:hypothetical protein